MQMRPPATPIINIDPYFSIWAEDSVLKGTVHWTGNPNTLYGEVFVDGEEYRFLGENNDCKIPPMNVENIEIDAFSTIITYKNNAIRLTVHFTSPTLLEDLYYASRPVAYAKTSFESLDGKEHDVKVKFIASEELVLNVKGEGRAIANPVSIDGVTAICMGNGKQKVLWRSGDDIRIDWGYLYLGVKGEGVVKHTLFNDMYAATIEADIKNDASIAPPSVYKLMILYR